jgi:RND family efflux transporter MFP subunit
MEYKMYALNTKQIVAAMLAILLPLGGALAHAQAPEASVELASVTERGVSAMVRLPGTVISRRDSQISAELSGRLNWVAEVGDEVEKGEPIAIIDDHLLQLQLRDNLAEIARVEADINYNQRQSERLERLAAQNNMAQSELDQVKSRQEMLTQDRTKAEVTRDRTLYDIERTQVRAPFPGIIADRQMNLGEYTSPGASLVRLVDTQTLEISVNAPLRAARFNKPGSEVQVESDDRQILTAIRSVIPVGDARSRLMELRIKLEPGHWSIGEAVTVDLVDGDRELSLSVPRDALVLRGDQVFVYTVSADNIAKKIPVIAGSGWGTTIAIDGDLTEGDPVIVRGAERLSDGQKVKVIRHHLAGS